MDTSPLARARGHRDECFALLIAVREALDYPRNLNLADDHYAEAAQTARKAGAAAAEAPDYYAARAPRIAVSLSLHCRAFAAEAKAAVEAAHASIMFSIAQESAERLRTARAALAMAEATAAEDQAYSDGASKTARRVRLEADAARETAEEAARAEDKAAEDKAAETI